MDKFIDSCALFVESMAKIFGNLAKLIDVKSIVTFAVIAVLCVVAVKSGITISEGAFMGVVSSIITYFFTKPTKTGGGE